MGKGSTYTKNHADGENDAIGKHLDKDVQPCDVVLPNCQLN